MHAVGDAVAVALKANWPLSRSRKSDRLTRSACVNSGRALRLLTERVRPMPPLGNGVLDASGALWGILQIIAVAARSAAAVAGPGRKLRRAPCEKERGQRAAQCAPRAHSRDLKARQR